MFRACDAYGSWLFRKRKVEGINFIDIAHILRIGVSDGCQNDGARPFLAGAAIINLCTE
jgi:hypothetical protein